jgi:CelD/BcsL family acetyltransferase involved in cellulose biosynthesis
MKIAHNEEWRRGAPGHLLFNGMLEQCAASNIPEFFFGGSKDRYKTSWTERSIPHYNGVIFAPGLRGELAFRLRTQVLSRLGQWRRQFRVWRASKKQSKSALAVGAANADSKSTHKIEGEVQ